MAKKESVSSKSIETLRKKRPGIHSKKKNSVHKTGKHYSKAYAGQGR